MAWFKRKWESGQLSEDEKDGRNYVWIEKSIVDRLSGITIEKFSVCIKSHDKLDKVRKAVKEDMKELTEK